MSPAARPTPRVPRELLDDPPSGVASPTPPAAPATPPTDLRLALLGEPAWVPLARVAVYLGVPKKRASEWVRGGLLGPEGVAWRKIAPPGRTPAQSAALVVHRDALLRFCRWDRSAS